MKHFLLPLLFLLSALVATAHAQAGGVVAPKAEARKAAAEYVKQCADNVRASRSALKERHRAERDALGKSVNTPEYRALRERQQAERQFAERIHKRDKKLIRKYAREAVEKGNVINTRRTFNVCYYVPSRF